MSLPALLARFRHVRDRTSKLAERLTDEDQMLQSMPACSPTKWHLAHTTWFFETFLLAPAGVPPFDRRFAYLFNSYYEGVGPRPARTLRGLLSRPSAPEVRAYRSAVDGRVVELLLGGAADRDPLVCHLLELGLAHEEQHQELILTDILHAFSASPLRPAYASSSSPPPARPAPLGFVQHDGGLLVVGSTGEGFAFDNELPAHRTFLSPFAIADRVLTLAELRAFVDAGGYREPSLWLSPGYDFVREQGIELPGYLRRDGDVFVAFGLDGERPLADHEPLAFVSYFEADAMARFLGARLATEQEWEVAARSAGGDGPPGSRHVWEWTGSAYLPYPGFAPARGAVGEYNGKFMSGQMVLRGASTFTPPSHSRSTYRNFWPPETRFQRTGVRLARDVR